MKHIKRILFIFIFIILACTLSLTIYLNTCCQTIVIDGTSMKDTLHEGQLGVYIKNNKKLKRNDIIVFLHEKDDYSNANFIKRIIALPGEHIQIMESGDIKVNNQLISQDYLTDFNKANTYKVTALSYVDVTLKENEYYVLGDNRDVSYDSRYFGPINKEQIEGKLFFTYGEYDNYDSSTNKGDKINYFPIKFY